MCGYNRPIDATTVSPREGEGITEKGERSLAKRQSAILAGVGRKIKRFLTSTVMGQDRVKRGKG